MSGMSETDTIDLWKKYFDDKIFIKNITSDGSFCVYEAGKENNNNICFIFLHGAGMTSLSFSLLVSKLKFKYQCIAFDYRNHGESFESTDLSIKTLVEDSLHVINKIVDKGKLIILVGHSLGGSIAIRVNYLKQDLNIVGLVVIDIVEGTALNALPYMENILNMWPKAFNSLDEAIKWNRKTKPFGNLDSIKISLPSQLRLINSNYEWRTNLYKTKKYWKDWYIGMSELFLKCDSSKLLILASEQSLDKTLTIAQMQGKFQLILIKNAGHEIHENKPDELADVLIRYINRNRFGEKLIV